MRVTLVMMMAGVIVLTGGRSVGSQGAVSNLVKGKLYSIRAATSNRVLAIRL